MGESLDIEKKKLSSGHTIPTVGFGTWGLETEEVLIPALEAAYNTGYRMVDTATIYGNEQIIGKWLKTKPRDQIFITTKLWNTDHGRVAEACQKSMDRLGVDYIDLYLVHWPVSQAGEFNVEKLWRDMEALVVQKKVRSIGVANFGVKNLTRILSFCKIKPAMLQIELHAYLPQNELREFCSRHGITVTSYSSLGSSYKEESVKDDKTIKEVADRYETCTTKILLSFCVALGCCVIPRSRSAEHIRSNYELIKLTQEDLDKINGIEKRKRYINAESFGPHRFE